LEVLLRFGDWVWNPNTLELRSGSQVVTLEPRVARLLEFLLNHPGELLTHDRLVEAVWGGRVVSNEAVRHAVFTLRQALATGDGAGLIRTIHKRGYIAEFPSSVVEETRSGTGPAVTIPGAAPQLPASTGKQANPTATGPRHTARSHRLAAALGVTILIALAAGLLALLDVPGERPGATTEAEVPNRTPATIAVLPFINLSQAADSEVLADGLAEELLGTLALNPELRVTARPSAFQFKEPDRDLRDIGRRLGVRYVLDGNVRNLGERVRIHARLVDANTGEQLWSNEYDRSLADWFSLQQVLAVEVARALEGVLQGREQPAVQADGTTSVEAHLEVLRARQLLATRAVADAEQASEHLQRALLLDPNYALAYARLADAILIQAESTGGVKAVRPVVAPLLDKALALNPRLGEAYCLRSLLTNDREAAERDLRRGLELNPSYARGYELLARLQTVSPLQSQEAIATIDSAIALDPLTPGNYHAKAVLMMGLGSWQEAAELDRRALELNPNFRAALAQLSEVYSVQGYFADAIEYARRAVALDPRAIPLRDQLTLLYLAVGDLDGARAANQPPTPFGSWAIPWAEGKYDQLVDIFYSGPSQLSGTIDPMISSQILLRQAVSDGDYARALAVLVPSLPTGDTLPPSATGWGLYAYANLVQLLRLGGDEPAAARLQAQLEDRMAAVEARFPRHALIHAQVRATLLARAGRSAEACASLENAYTPNPRPMWRVILANPAFDAWSATPCFAALRTRIEEHIATERKRIAAMQHAAQAVGSDRPNVDRGANAAS
jgi:TolB-like protein/DNA-binding winged helix-turn-helix (wHTH) protein/Flp pilus assembly protein TadD